MNLIDKYFDHILEEKEVTVAEEIVFGIIHNLTGRKGFDAAWEEIDSDIQEEILQDCINIVNGGD